MKKQLAAQVRLISFLTFGFSLLLLFACLTSSAQTAPPITSSGLNTRVSPPATLPSGKVQYDITAGTRAGGGANLFHSFGEFGVPNNNIATFLNDTPNLATSNILGRVTGGNISNIFGTIQTTGFGNANLFLMNPAGFLFGPNATVNVGGMVSFTSADYLRLADNARFTAVSGPSDALLTASPVVAFGFLGSNPGAITVQGSQLTVTPGISLVGGNITIQSGTPEGGTAQPARLSTPNGKIQLASAASPGEFDAATLQPLPNVNNTSFTSFGSASLAPGSNITVSGEQTVAIRGGQFVLSVNDAVLSTAQSPGPPETISLSPGSSISSANAGTDAGADVQLISSNVQMDGTFIQSLTAGEGSGGNISMTAALDEGPNSSTAGSVQIKGGQIQTVTVGPGTVGDILINSATLSMTDGALIDTLLVPNPLIPGQPGGGAIAITATDSIFVSGHRPGPINLLPSVPGLPTFTNMPSGIYSHNFAGIRGSNILLQTPKLTLQQGGIASLAFGSGPGGDATFVLRQLALENGGQLYSYNFGDGASGRIQVAASESISISGFSGLTFQIGSFVRKDIPSSISSSSTGAGKGGQVSVSTSTLTMDEGSIASVSFGPGGAGDVNVQARSISLTGGAGFGGSTFSSGNGGNLSVTASEQISISGRSGRSLQIGSLTFPPHESGIGASAYFGTGKGGAVTITTPTLTMLNDAQISTSTGSDGAGGSIIVNANRITLSSGALISSSSGLISGDLFLVGNGAAGTIQLNATESLIIRGHSPLNSARASGVSSTTVSRGLGGNITVQTPTLLIEDGGVISAATQGAGRAGQIFIDVTNAVTLQNEAHISSSSTGAGRAGDITINAGNLLTMTNGSIITEANQSSGGAIKVTTNPTGTMQLTDSTISASVLDGTGGGGSVNIDPELVILQNSQILANAIFGLGGNINLTTNLLLPDSASIISASSQFGQQGTVSIQSPISPASGKIIPLSQKPLIDTSLMGQRCGASTGGIYSSFTVAGRDSLPAEPGGWISSPLALGLHWNGGRYSHRAGHAQKSE